MAPLRSDKPRVSNETLLISWGKEWSLRANRVLLWKRRFAFEACLKERSRGLKRGPRAPAV